MLTPPGLPGEAHPPAPGGDALLARPRRHHPDQALHPETLVWPECATGQTLADFESEDGHSSRYGVVNPGADDRRGLLERLDAVVGRLGFDLRPVAPRP